MGLIEQVQIDLTAAMRQREEIKVGALRMLLADLRNLAVARTDTRNPQHGQPVTEGDLLQIVDKAVKQHQESVEMFRNGGREELAAKEQAEIAVIQAYLPARMSRDEIVAYVRGLIQAHGATFKAVMPVAARELRGKADGGVVQQVVRELTAVG